ncbi:hypothetical protein [Bacteroides sp. UBA939]|uniref:hypothetical protein n=1 Tax=Bacteroides sp. UBA939 TaxID=1946092 RepID=UPI0025C51FC3|nr:hypothetical protein [Bacteroides sp. UBA939]
MKKILNVSEMKQVRGGAIISDYCYPGEKLYTCTTTYGNGFQSTGAVCAGNGLTAVTLVYAQRKKEDVGAIETIACA